MGRFAVTARTTGKTRRKSQVAAEGEPTAAEKRRARQIEGKRSAILEAALALFAQYGVHGASLDQIAVLADVSKTNLLYYFSNKDELYKAVLQRILDVWVDPLEHFTVDKSPEQAISEYVRAKLEVSRDHSSESKLFCMEVMQGAPLMLGELQHPLRDKVELKVKVIEGWIERGALSAVDPHHLIFSIWATTQHYADFATQIEAITGKSLQDPAYFEATCANICTLLLRGIVPRD